MFSLSLLSFPHQSCAQFSSAASLPQIGPRSHVASAIALRFTANNVSRVDRTAVGYLAYDPRDWWTGEDSNLRSPQGAADLQSAGFSHSPTRPGKFLRDYRASPKRLHEISYIRCSTKHKTDSCPETPARRFCCSDSAPPHSPANFLLVELAEGIEPPTL